MLKTNYVTVTHYPIPLTNQVDALATPTTRLTTPILIPNPQTTQNPPKTLTKIPPSTRAPTKIPPAPYIWRCPVQPTNTLCAMRAISRHTPTANQTIFFNCTPTTYWYSNQHPVTNWFATVHPTRALHLAATHTPDRLPMRHTGHPQAHTRHQANCFSKRTTTAY